MYQDFGEGIIGCLMGGGGGAVGPSFEEYLTIEQVAQRLQLSPKTIRNKIASCSFIKGKHYFRPAEMGTRFKWSAVREWIEEENPNVSSLDEDESIPMARGYRLGESGMKIAVAKRQRKVSGE